MRPTGDPPPGPPPAPARPPHRRATQGLLLPAVPRGPATGRHLPGLLHRAGSGAGVGGEPRAARPSKAGGVNAAEIARILDMLGERLGPTGQYVFALAVRQQF